jgi:uncharacterized protein (DUF305 family)
MRVLKGFDAGPGTGLGAGIATALTLVALLGGCTSEPVQGSGEDLDRAAADVTVLQPGRPGEPAPTVGPEQTLDEDEWNHADAAFMQMMVPHHGQALVMAQLAEVRAHSPAVQALARRIRGAQGPEIIMMAAWLDERGIDVPNAAEKPGDDHGAHGHSGMQGMQGMLSEEEMEQLRSASGRRFDRLFLDGMIVHHQGAVDMAETVAREGVDVRVSEIAADVAAGQSAEIQRMRELLASP